jgi:hypothetical protein
MAEKTNNNRRNYFFNLGFRRGANDRHAAGLPLSRHTPRPKMIPTPPTECSCDEEREIWTRGYKMGFVVGASEKDLEKFGPPMENQSNTAPEPN